MFVWKSYEKFASSTELHGFDQVLKYNRFWAAVWLCLTIAACGMCVNDVITLVVTYQMEPKLVTLVRLPNIDLDPPNPTLCMEVYVDPPASLEIGYLEQAKIQKTLCPSGIGCKHTLLDVAATLYEYNTTAMDADLESFLTATNNAENLDIPYFDKLNLTDRLQYFTYLMLSYITEAEMTYVGHNYNDLTSFVVNYSLVANDLNTENFKKQISYIYQAYLRRKVDFANLKRLIGMSICQQRTDSLTKMNSTYNNTSHICKPRMITHLSFSIVCSKLLGDNNDHLANYDNLTLNGTMIAGIPPFAIDLVVAGMQLTNDMVTFAWHLDFKGRPFVPPSSRQDVASWDPTVTTGIDLTVANEFQFYNTKLDPCQSQQWQYDCEWDTRIGMMEDKCGCRPSSLLYRTNSSLPTCSQNPTKPAWTQSHFTGICDGKQADRLSSSYCVRDCNDFSFGIEYTAPSIYLKKGMANVPLPPPTGVLEVSLRWDAKRRQVTEVLAKDFASFICEFGGSIGAWLGASLLAFVHAAIHIFLTCYDTGKQLAKSRKAKHVPNAET